MWQHSTDPKCIKLSVEDCGWIMKNEMCEPLWFEGEPSPLNIDDILIKDDNFESDDEDTQCNYGLNDSDDDDE